jgi:hypothetical protein
LPGHDAPQRSVSGGIHGEGHGGAPFNGDGKPDLAGIVNGQVEVLLGNGDGTFQTEKTTSINSPVSLAAADFKALQSAPFRAHVPGEDL